jgi:hypothetical protein
LAKHGYFEELCALAPIGELSPSQLRELEDHIVECNSCRQAMLDYDRILRQVIPAGDDSDATYVASRRNDLHDAVLRGISEIDREREVAVAAATVAPIPPVRLRRGGFLFPFAAGACAASLVAASIFIGGHFSGPVNQAGARKIDAASTSPSPSVVQLPPKSPVATPTPNVHSDVASPQFIATLDAERQHSADLAKKLSIEDGELTKALDDESALRALIDQQTQTLAATKADLDAKTTALAQARSSSSSDSATIASLELRVHDLTEKANTQSASLDRERDLLSHGREIRDIIGARNLHIIDVYDTGMEGETRKPFARAFYTEGKSLVYYAYDLPQRRADAGKFSYVAWGESNGNKASIRKIGILFHDDQTQRRWSLNFADPQVLREIDSVFITLERNDEDVAQPKGKRMLTAYLGMPANHP